MDEHDLDLRDRFVDWKVRATELCRELAQLCAEAVAEKDTGGAASMAVTSKDEIETWGGVAKLCDGDIEAAIEWESPLRFDWWAAILDCPDPDEAREVAHHEQLGKTQIRRRFGVVRHKQPDPPAYKGAAKVNRCTPSVAVFHLDLAEEPLELTAGDDVWLTVQRKAK